jgi:hypothetical protein
VDWVKSRLIALLFEDFSWLFEPFRGKKISVKERENELFFGLQAKVGISLLRSIVTFGKKCRLDL